MQGEMECETEPAGRSGSVVRKRTTRAHRAAPAPRPALERGAVPAGRRGQGHGAAGPGPGDAGLEAVRRSLLAVMLIPSGPARAIDVGNWCRAVWLGVADGAPGLP